MCEWLLLLCQQGPHWILHSIVKGQRWHLWCVSFLNPIDLIELLIPFCEDEECCDGSDEYSGLVKCPNRCSTVAAKFDEDQKATNALLEEVIPHRSSAIINPVSYNSLFFYAVVVHLLLVTVLLWFLHRIRWCSCCDWLFISQSTRMLGRRRDRDAI